MGRRGHDQMKIAIALGVAAFGLTARAQQLPALSDFDLERLEVNSSESGSLVVGTGEMSPAGALRFSLAGNYENNPLLFQNESGAYEGAVVSDRYTIHMVAGWAPFDWLELAADVPLIAAQFSDLAAGTFQLQRNGIGSPTGTIRMGLLSQRKGSLTDVAVQLGVRVPVGTDGAYASDGRIGLAPKVMIGRNFEWLRGGLEAGVRWRPGGPPGLDGEMLLAAVVSTGAPDGLRGELSARSFLGFRGEVGSVELLAGARYPIGLMDLWVLAGPGLGQQNAPGTPAWRVLVGANFGNGLASAGAAAPSTIGSDIAPRSGGEIPSAPVPQASSGPSSTGASEAAAAAAAVTAASGGTLPATLTVPDGVPVVGGTTINTGAVTGGNTGNSGGTTVPAGGTAPAPASP